jgi:hypothetical protein
MMRLYTNQYKISFILLWFFLYIFYPTWALPVSITGRTLIFSGMMVYFTISGFLVIRWLDSISMNKPFIIMPQNLLEDIKDHKWLLIISIVAIGFHVPRITMPILNLGDEALHIQGGLWVYYYLGERWHNAFRLCFIIIVFFAFIGIFNKRVREFYLHIHKILYHKIHTSVIVIFLLLILAIYFVLVRDIHYDLFLVRYPPVSRVLYLLSFFIAGINHIAPRVIQLTFYFFTTIYLYRSILLFSERKTALFAIPLYLFSPVVFHYAHLSQLTSGVVFFVVLISFYFLRYLRDKDKRDLLISSFFISLGFLYKEDILLMLFICSLYMIIYKFRDVKELIDDLRILGISIVSVIPWMIMQRFINWRQYTIHWEHFTSDVAYIYLKLLWIQSHPILPLFLLSIPFVFINKRNHLISFYGLIFLAYYLFYTADYTAPYGQHRFSVAFYPTISIFLSHFLFEIIKRIRFRYSFKIGYAIIMAYLIIHTTDQSLGRYLFPDRELKFPVDRAMQWVKENINEGEKMVLLRIMPVRFYSIKYRIPMNRFVWFWYELGEVSTYEGLKDFCVRNNIKYIMFPYSPDYPKGQFGKLYNFLRELKENKNNDFIVLSQFNVGKDYIYIYSLK